MFCDAFMRKPCSWPALPLHMHQRANNREAVQEPRGCDNEIGYVRSPRHTRNCAGGRLST